MHVRIKIFKNLKLFSDVYCDHPTEIFRVVPLTSISLNTLYNTYNII